MGDLSDYTTRTSELRYILTSSIRQEMNDSQLRRKRIEGILFAQGGKGGTEASPPLSGKEALEGARAWIAHHVRLSF